MLALKLIRISVSTYRVGVSLSEIVPSGPVGGVLEPRPNRYICHMKHFLINCKISSESKLNKMQLWLNWFGVKTEGSKKKKKKFNSV